MPEEPEKFTPSSASPGKNIIEQGATSYDKKENVAKEIQFENADTEQVPQGVKTESQNNVDEQNSLPQKIHSLDSKLNEADVKRVSQKSDEENFGDAHKMLADSPVEIGKIELKSRASDEELYKTPPDPTQHNEDLLSEPVDEPDNTKQIQSSKGNSINSP